MKNKLMLSVGYDDSITYWESRKFNLDFINNLNDHNYWRNEEVEP